MLRVLKLGRPPIDGQTCMQCELLEQRMGRARCIAQPRRRTRIVKHTAQTIAVLLVKLPGRSNPILSQGINTDEKKRVNGRRIKKPIASAAGSQQFEST